MKKLISTAAALLMAAPLGAAPPSEEGWYLVSEHEDRDYWIRNKDWTAGRPADRSVLVWTWVDHKANRSIAYENLLLEINCPIETYRFVKIQSFDHRGKVTTHSGSSWEFASPSSIIGEIVRLTCMEPAPAPTAEQPRNERGYW